MAAVTRSAVEDEEEEEEEAAESACARRRRRNAAVSGSSGMDSAGDAVNTSATTPNKSPHLQDDSAVEVILYKRITIGAREECWGPHERGATGGRRGGQKEQGCACVAPRLGPGACVSLCEKALQAMFQMQ